MGWTSNVYWHHADLKKKQSLLRIWGGCDHVNNDPSLLHAVRYLNTEDCREGTCLCRSCLEDALAIEDSATHQCVECNSWFHARQMTGWQGYGKHNKVEDQPVWVCDSCTELDQGQGSP